MKKLISIVLTLALLIAPNINSYAQIWKDRTIYLTEDLQA